MILISSPLTMLLTLWAMTTERALQLLLGRQRPAADLVTLAQLGQQSESYQCAAMRVRALQQHSLAPAA